MEELEVIVVIVKDYGMYIVVYVYGVEGMKWVVVVGIIIIEYGIFMIEEVMDLMIENEIYYVLMILVGNFVVEKVKIKGYFFKIIVFKVLSVGL